MPEAMNNLVNAGMIDININVIYRLFQIIVTAFNISTKYYTILFEYESGAAKTINIVKSQWSRWFV